MRARSWSARKLFHPAAQLQQEKEEQEREKLRHYQDQYRLRRKAPHKAETGMASCAKGALTTNDAAIPVAADILAEREGQRLYVQCYRASVTSSATTGFVGPLQEIDSNEILQSRSRGRPSKNAVAKISTPADDPDIG